MYAVGSDQSTWARASESIPAAKKVRSKYPGPGTRTKYPFTDKRDNPWSDWIVTACSIYIHRPIGLCWHKNSTTLISLVKLNSTSPLTWVQTYGCSKEYGDFIKSCRRKLSIYWDSNTLAYICVRGWNNTTIIVWKLLTFLRKPSLKQFYI